MAKLYAVEILSKQKQRRDKIDDILENEVMDYEPQYLKTIVVPTKNLFNAKTWKTSPGAARYIKELKYRYEHSDYKSFSKLSGNHTIEDIDFRIVDVTEKWNNIIDNKVADVKFKYRNLNMVTIKSKIRKLDNLRVY